MMTHYYILFQNYEEGMALHGLLDKSGVANRIAPAPAAARGKLCCGMSLLLEESKIDAAKAVIAEHSAVYHSIVPMEDQLRARRDRYC